MELNPEQACGLLARHGLADPDTRVRLSVATGGASRQTFVIDAAQGGQAGRKFVLRVQGDATTSGHSLPVEAQLLALAGQAGVPVPRVLAAGTAGDDILGAPFILVEYVAGETLPKRIRSGPSFARAREVLAGQLGDALGRLHLASLASAPAQLETVEDPVAFWADALAHTGQPHPAFEIGIGWLRANRPEPRDAVLVHGDFRLGNLIIGPDGLRAVLDWELSLIGDPRLDMGWLCSPSWRFGGPAPVGGIGEYEPLLRAYAQVTGVEIGADELHWFEVLATLRWGVLCIGQAMRHITGTTRSVELAALGRRVCEMEWTLMKATR